MREKTFWLAGAGGQRLAFAAFSCDFFAGQFRWIRGFESDTLNFKTRAEQKRSGAEESARGKFAGEIGAVNGVEFFEERNVRAKNLNENEVVHAETGAGERFAEGVEHAARFLLGIRGDFLRLRIEADVAAQIKSVAGENAHGKWKWTQRGRQRNPRNPVTTICFLRQLRFLHSCSAN